MVREIVRAIMRGICVGVLIGVGLVSAPHAAALPDTCPPNCDRIPATAWPASTALPLNSDYHWPLLSGIAVPAPAPRLRFAEFCASPKLSADPLTYAVAEKAQTAAPDGQWQLQAQVIHWRGDTSTGGRSVESVFEAANLALRLCPVTAPEFGVLFTTDKADRMAAVLTGPGGQVVHEYLLAHPQSSTITELTFWDTPGTGGSPSVPWPAVGDAQVFDAMSAPLCAAYLSSCG